MMMVVMMMIMVIHMMMMMTLSTRRQLGDTGEDLGFQRVLRLSWPGFDGCFCGIPFKNYLFLNSEGTTTVKMRDVANSWERNYITHGNDWVKFPKTWHDIPNWPDIINPVGRGPWKVWYWFCVRELRYFAPRPHYLLHPMNPGRSNWVSGGLRGIVDPEASPGIIQWK